MTITSKLGTLVGERVQQPKLVNRSAVARRRDILVAIARSFISKGISPSIREICTATGITSSSVVQYYLRQMEAVGLVERTVRISRGLTLTEAGWDEARSYGSGITRPVQICPHCNRDIHAPAPAVEFQVERINQPRQRRSTRMPLAS